MSEQDPPLPYIDLGADLASPQNWNANTSSAEAFIADTTPVPSVITPADNAALANVQALEQYSLSQWNRSSHKNRSAQIRSMSVVGAGTMGQQISMAALSHGMPVTLTDVNAEVLALAEKQITGQIIASKSQQKKYRPHRTTTGTLTTTASIQQVATADLVLETVVEQLAIKHQVFADLEPHLSEQAVLVSNTSSIPIDRLAAGLNHPDRFCGIHFLMPVETRRVVEIVRGKATSDQTVATATAYVRQIGRMPLVVNDGPGFLVTRLLLPYLNAALKLLGEGASIQQIDEAAHRFGMSHGPLEMFDAIGLDTAMMVGRAIWEAWPDRVVLSPILARMIKLKRKGYKSGVGFYSYPTKEDATPITPQLDPQAAKIIEPYIVKPRSHTNDELVTRLILPMLLEATRALEAKIVSDARDVDVAMVFGLGFPAERGGLLFWGDQLGAKQVIESLRPFAALGERFCPPQTLHQMAKTNQRFYP